MNLCGRLLNSVSPSAPMMPVTILSRIVSISKKKRTFTDSLCYLCFFLFCPADVYLFLLKVIGRMCKIIDKTCLSPTPTLEQHLMWDDIAILARYMLMLSFNNSLDVAAHLPYLFHVVTLLVATGPLSLRASTHGLVINIIHSLCTCSQLNFSGEDPVSNKI